MLRKEWIWDWKQEACPGFHAVYTAVLIFVLCFVFVYLLLSAQYESYILPLSVLLSVPFGLLGSFLFVSGIGFIGAGTIIFQKQIVRGLTTAAGIWATSGIGLAIGAGMYWLGISATILTLIGLEALSYLFKSIGMKSSMVEFSTDNKETLNRMAKKFNSKEYNIVSYQLDEKRLGEVTTYYVTMVIKSKKYNDEGMLLTLLQDFSDITVHRLE